MLNLTGNDIGDVGAKELADALTSGQCPKGLKLNIERNNIGYEGAKVLASALASGNCQEGLVLNLKNNSIGDEGAKVLATALASGNCPEGLVLNLEDNEIDNEGKEALENALLSGKVPFGTKIIGLGTRINQLCRDNDQSIKKKRDALLVLSSSKITNLPTPNNLIPERILGEILSYLPGCLHQREINALISSDVIVQRNPYKRDPCITIFYAGVRLTYDVELQPLTDHDPQSSDLACSPNAAGSFFPYGIPHVWGRHDKKIPAAATPFP